MPKDTPNPWDNKKLLEIFAAPDNRISHDAKLRLSKGLFRAVGTNIDPVRHPLELLIREVIWEQNFRR